MNKERDDVERTVLEVRRTTMVPKVQSERMVFERHEDEWHVHFSAATNYSITQMREIVSVMKDLPLIEKELREDE